MDVSRGRARGSGLILTVGYATRTLPEFIALLRAHAVKQIVDVRAVPHSRTNPIFNRDSLPDALKAAGIAYVSMRGLGGFRYVRADSPTAGGKHASFRGFVDYMQTPAFETSLKALISFAQDARTAIMCAELVPWHCHRSLIADALVVRGVPVKHILSPVCRQSHRLTSWAWVSERRHASPAA